MILRDRLVSNLRLQASRARRLAEGGPPDVQARLLACADEFERQALALNAQQDEISDDQTKTVTWPSSDDND